MKGSKSLFIISLLVIFLLSTTKSIAQLQTSHYFRDIFGYNSIYSSFPFINSPWMSNSFFDNSSEFPNYNNFSDFSYPYFPYPGINPPHSLFTTSPTSPISYNFSWMFGPYWNPLNGYYNFLEYITFSNQGNKGNNSVSELINKPWKLQSFGVIGEEKSLIPDTEITIRFNEDKGYKGSAGCNEYSGTYEVLANDILSISLTGFTEMACVTPSGIMEQEEEYLEALENVYSFEINQDNLKLFYDDDKQKVINFMMDDNYASKLKRTWKLQSFGTIDEEKSLIPNTWIHITFTIFGIFEENSNCLVITGDDKRRVICSNEYLGAYEASNTGVISVSTLEFSNTLEFSDTICDSPGVMEQAEECLEALRSVCSFEIYQDNINLLRYNLKLFYDNGKKVLKFINLGSVIIPEWLTQLVDQYKEMGRRTDFTRYTYHNEIVYYLPIWTYDGYSTLWDAVGNVICFPDGGFCGWGDGKCPDFSSERKNEIRLRF